MDLTSEGIAQAVFDRMAAKDCDEEAATQYVYQNILRNAESLKELWREEGRRIIHRWTGEAMRGFNGGGPRPSVPLNYGRNRRQERRADIPYLSTLLRLPDGKIRRLGELTGEEVDLIVNWRRGIASKNLYHAEEWEHVRSFIADQATLADCVDALDERADTYLRATVARMPEPASVEAA